MIILRTVRRCNPPDWLVGAGLIRNLAACRKSKL
jgi:hypothetical protein